MNFSKQKSLAYFAWSLPLLFFTFQFILRLWPGLNMQQIMQQFSINASQFGLLAAFYYYGYAGMQIPVAVLLDRFGVRNVVFAFATLCGLAALLFTFTHNWYLACLSRMLVGVGSAVGFLGVSKMISQRFAHSHYARMVGLSFTFGLLGAIYGGKPVTLLIQQYHWQFVAVGLGFTAIAIGVFNLVFLKLVRSKITVQTEERIHFRDLKFLLVTPKVWWLAVGNLLMVGALEGFADVWGVPYLMTAYHLPKTSAAQLISCVYVGMLFGGPVLAHVSKKLGNYSVIALSGLCMALAFWPVLSMPVYHGWLLAGILFLVGVLCCYQVIVFAAGSNLVEARYLGVTVAFLNSINMFGGSFFHTLIGKVMDIYWDGSVNDAGVRLYDLTAYHHAIMLIPMCACVGATIVTLLGAYEKRGLNNPIEQGVYNA